MGIVVFVVEHTVLLVDCIAVVDTLVEVAPEVGNNCHSHRPHLEEDEEEPNCDYE
jgi:hypothetical protein